MQNITRLAVVVALFVSGTGWTVAAYLDCLHGAPEVVPGAVAAEPEAAEGAPRTPATIVLSVDPTQDSVVSMR